MREPARIAGTSGQSEGTNGRQTFGDAARLLVRHGNGSLPLRLFGSTKVASKRSCVPMMWRSDHVGSELLLTLAARKYTLEVYAPGNPSGLTYKQSLLDLRSQLQDLTLTSEASAASVTGAVAELATVESALHQLHNSPTFQSCSGPITTGVVSHATVTWTTSGLTVAGIWTLSCG